MVLICQHTTNKLNFVCAKLVPLQHGAKVFVHSLYYYCEDILGSGLLPDIRKLW